MKPEDFLTKYGWERIDTQDDDEFESSFIKDGFFGMDMSKTEIFFVSDTGLFLTIPKDIFALVGALVYYRQIPYNFILQIPEFEVQNQSQ